MATAKLQSDPDFDSAHVRIQELCDHFDGRRDEMMAASYKEDAARNEFITPFFEALGWDVRNTAHRSVYEKDVVTEKREDIAGTARSADYAFRRPGTHLTAFFVEAKKPSVDIRSHGPCYQAVLYGWNASTPLVVRGQTARRRQKLQAASAAEHSGEELLVCHGLRQPNALGTPDRPTIPQPRQPKARSRH